MTERDCENYKHHISRDCENCWESAEPTSADEQIQSIVEKRVAELVHLNYELEQQLADRPRGEWIPCSERLPNVGEDVLFCDSEWTEKGWLMANGDWWRLCWSMVIPKEEVTAWMPLPKPYREDGEE